MNSGDLNNTLFNYASKSCEESVRYKFQSMYGSGNWNENEWVPQFTIPH